MSGEGRREGLRPRHCVPCGARCVKADHLAAPSHWRAAASALARSAGGISANASSSIGSPLPAFAPNYPPCLQTTTIPDPQAPLPTSELLKAYLPNTGTLGKLVSFYDLFSYTASYVPVVPHKGPEDELFFDQTKYPAANQALIEFRNTIQGMVRTVQPDWVQIGQWPRNIEL